MKFKTEFETCKERNLTLDGFVITNHEIDVLVGKVLTFIETLGFPEQREHATKDTIKQIIRGSIGKHRNSVMSEELTRLILQFNEQLHEECIKLPKDIMMSSGNCLRDGKYSLSFEGKL